MRLKLVPYVKPSSFVTHLFGREGVGSPELMLKSDNLAFGLLSAVKGLPDNKT